ncbi:MAG TPA: PadR family transcriptional regulator [Coleofasciculaceae cyanobacterium]|jgi:DNA-binding PadR family transcriptional regulator
MLELATLGLLQHEPLHGYRLKQQLELFMSSSISVNYGAIYPLLKRLEERGELATLVTDQTEAGLSRKTYCITAKGRQRWHQKMMEYPHESWVNSRSRFFIKFFFFGNLEHLERIKLLEHRLSVCQLRLESLEVEQLSLTDPYQKDVLQHCFDVHRAEIEWLREQLVKEQKERYDCEQQVRL